MESCYDDDDGLAPDSFFHHFSKYGVEHVQEACDVFFDNAAKGLPGTRRRNVTVAIDMNDVEYWGKKDLYVHYKRGDRKNVYVHRYATLAIVDSGYRFTLACFQVKKTDSLIDVVQYLLDKAGKHVRIDTILMDRGFYNAKLLKMIECRGMDYVIPLRKTKGSQKLYMQAKREDVWRVPYTMCRYVDNLYTNMYLQTDGDGYIGLLSNKQVSAEAISQFFKWYETRWNIEISYKEAKSFRARTSSTRKEYRLLLYCITHILSNLMQQVRSINNTRFKANQMKKLVARLLQGTFKEHKLSRTLIAKKENG
jgi:IS4 transposase